MDELILDLITLIKAHRIKNKLIDSRINDQLKQLVDLIARDQEVHHLFFNDLTQSAQLEFLESTGLDYTEIDESRPIAKLELLQSPAQAESESESESESHSSHS